MKRPGAVVMVGLACTFLTLALSARAQTDPGAGLPPPGVDDPGVSAAASVAPRPTSAPDTAADGVVPHDELPPTVKIRRQGNDIVQEYSHGGQVYMIKVIPPDGIEQTYRDLDRDGRLDLQPGRAPVAPIYYTLYEWGKPKPKDDED